MGKNVIGNILEPVHLDTPLLDLHRILDRPDALDRLLDLDHRELDQPIASRMYEWTSGDLVIVLFRVVESM